MSLPDAVLIQRVLKGESEMFDRLMARYDATVSRHIRQYIKDEQDAQDLSQDVWLSVFQRMGRMRSPENFKGWLYTIVRSHCLYHLRRQRNALPMPEEIQAGCDPEEDHMRRARHRRLMHGIDSLSNMLRRTVTLYYIAGYTCLEVSHRLNVPVGTVKRRLSDARKQLRRIFDDWSQQSGTRLVLDH